MTLFDEAVAKVGAEEAGATGNERFFHGVNV